MKLDPDVAAVRTAVTRAARDASALLVACSGGADSMALAAAVAFVAPRMGVPAGLVTVDHQLQAGSGERAAAVADWARAGGFDPVEVRAVDVAGRGRGPEAAAREARYDAIADVARGQGGASVLLGHTRDDQAETVLLALVRGAGPRGLAGMPARREHDGIVLVRPLLEISRAQTRRACAALGLAVWDDPHNHDPAFTRSRARVLLTSLTDQLGPAVVANLARTAGLIAADTALLDDQATRARVDTDTPDGGLRVAALTSLPDALRTRILHQWARERGADASALAQVHIDALDALSTAWRGQGPAHLPGGIVVWRRGGELRTD